MTPEERAAEAKAKEMPATTMGTWLEEYKGCSCTLVSRYKRDLIGYCGRHGGSMRNTFRLPSPTEVGLF